MYIIFGRKICSGCQDVCKKFESDGIDFEYIDLDKMREEQRQLAIYYEAFKEGRELPYIINTDNDNIWDNFEF